MKHLICSLGFLLTASCASLKPQHPYNGTWILKQQTGGFAGRATTLKTETKLVIKNDKMRTYENGKLLSEELFKVEKGKVIQSSEPQDVLATNRIMKQSIAVKGDTLIIADQCYDCFTYRYERKK